MTIKAVCIHVRMSDNRGKLCDAEHSWLPVVVDNRETLCDDKSGLHTCSLACMWRGETNFRDN